MISIRWSEERGQANHGWLDSLHTFSFGTYHDPEQMGFGVLRVINEDHVEPNTGFGRHSHRDMEIITYVLEGALEHRDSMGNGSILRAGDVQRMSAGTGVVHSEMNPSKADPVRFLQVWILPEVKGTTPEYEQKSFPQDDQRGRWKLLVSPDGRQDSLRIHQDVWMHGARLGDADRIAYELGEWRSAWIQVVRGEVTFAGKRLHSGDGVAVREEKSIELVGLGEGPAEILLFDLPDHGL